MTIRAHRRTTLKTTVGRTMKRHQAFIYLFWILFTITQGAEDKLRSYESTISTVKDAERPERAAACKLPKVKSFTVKQIEDDVNHDVCVQLSWKARQSNFNKWCSSEGWKIFVSSWDTVANIPEEDFADEDSSTATFNWSELVTVPLVNHSVTICHLRNDTYYEFKLNATFQKKSQIKPIKALSHLYYFGQQVPARIVSAPLHLNLKVGETLVLPCRVDGFPKPHVYWGRVLTGNQRSGSISTGRVPHGTYAPFYHIEVLNNINTSANGFYQCSVENKIVNPPEGIREIKERWMVKVTVS